MSFTILESFYEQFDKKANPDKEDASIKRWFRKNKKWITYGSIGIVGAIAIWGIVKLYKSGDKPIDSLSCLEKYIPERRPPLMPHKYMNF